MIAAAFLIALALGCVGYVLSKKTLRAMHRLSTETLPPPERNAERMYGQQYFERAVKRG